MEITKIKEMKEQFKSKRLHKTSLRYRMTWAIMCIVLTMVFLFLIMNKVFLPRYYEYNKKKNLGENYIKLLEKMEQTLYGESHDSAGLENGVHDEIVISCMQEMQRRYNINTTIYTNSENLGIMNMTEIYYTNVTNTERGEIKQRDTIDSYRKLYKVIGESKNNKYEENGLTGEILNDDDDYIIMKYTVATTPRENMVLMGHLGSEDSSVGVVLECDYASISESANISNKFLLYLGILIAGLASILVFFVSNSIAKPILELSDIAEKMANLDFDVKYEVVEHDEIGILGSSINRLSDQLKEKISELKLANIELQNDIEQKNKIDEMRKEFLSNISHELKTPIALVQGYAEGLKDNVNEDEESKEFYCDVIIDEARKMNNMVKKLLDLNHLEFGDASVSIERFDIVALINGILGSTDILFKQKETSVIFEQEKPVYVWADEFMVEEVVTNYISNALNHIDGNKIVEIKIIEKEGLARVAVFNTGKNIPEEDIDRIWEKFYKVDKARTREYGGSGVGLSIVKVIMELHHKDYGVLNRKRGVEFWFELDTKA